MRFLNREAAGRKLAKVLQQYGGKDAVVLALPRGGVVTGFEVAKKLGVPLGLIMVRKIGHPAFAEYAIGAITESGSLIFNESETATLDGKWLKAAKLNARRLMAYRRKLYFGDTYTPPKIKDKTVIIVDDGIATGLTMEAATLAVQNEHPKRVVIAAPVASPEAIVRLQTFVDTLVVLDDHLREAVGAHYLSFPEVDDDLVRQLLKRRQDNGIQ